MPCMFLAAPDDGNVRQRTHMAATSVLGLGRQDLAASPVLTDNTSLTRGQRRQRRKSSAAIATTAMRLIVQAVDGAVAMEMADGLIVFRSKKSGRRALTMPCAVKSEQQATVLVGSAEGRWVKHLYLPTAWYLRVVGLRCGARLAVRILSGRR